MSKDRDNKFHPGKGKPSGSLKENNFNASELEDDFHTAEDSTSAASGLTKDMKIQHPNRSGKTNTKIEKGKAEENRIQKGKIEMHKSENPSLVQITEIPPRIAR